MRIWEGGWWSCDSETLSCLHWPVWCQHRDQSCTRSELWHRSGLLDSSMIPSSWLFSSWIWFVKFLVCWWKHNLNLWCLKSTMKSAIGLEWGLKSKSHILHKTKNLCFKNMYLMMLGMNFKLSEFWCTLAAEQRSCIVHLFNKSHRWLLWWMSIVTLWSPLTPLNTVTQVTHCHCFLSDYLKINNRLVNWTHTISIISEVYWDLSLIQWIRNYCTRESIWIAKDRSWKILI